MTSKVETSTPPDVMAPIGPYSHIAKANGFIAISATAGIDPALPKPGALVTMNLTAVERD